ncbi:Integrase, catalytic core [Corchorus capsularis]|uniref:Integrase, catalytic core n=1 Tax=Corchorus capsularis TaxID=210143 RepID=A0A1R3G3Z7_COCAP|nr:Integrase, catalytic core [Corchorus capsularis]
MEYENININLESTNNTALQQEPLAIHDDDEVEEVEVGSSSSRKRRRTCSKFDPLKLRELVIAAIIIHNLHLSFMEYKGITALLSYCLDGHGLSMVSRNTAKADMLKLHATEKGRVKSSLEDAPVQDGLKEVDEAITKVRESIKYVKGSKVRKQKFLECVNLVSLNSKRGLRQDAPTRWNSTFLMLQSAIYFRKTLSHLEISDSNYRHCHNKDEWDRSEKLCTFLGDSYDVNCVFSGTKYPTSNLYFPAIYSVRVSLQAHLNGTDEFMKNMAARMFTKFEKYWSDFSIIVAIACVLDPHYKLSYVEWVYKKLYGAYSDEFKKEFDLQEALYEVDMKKSQLELYLKEKKEDRRRELNVINFWRANLLVPGLMFQNNERYGHYKSECLANLDGKDREMSNFAEKEEEESILMVCHVKEETQSNMWYLDSGCSNHMSGDKEAFSKLDESFRSTVKLGDNSKVSIMGKGKSCFSAQLVDEAWLWHFRYGHLNFGGLKTLQQKNMVNGLPQITIPFEEKSEAFACFKSFKVLVEKEASCPIKVLRTDRGGEYTSDEFAIFCDTHGIKRQLTTAYTPKHNGVCERKNRAILNMVRTFLRRSGVPKTFLLEAVNWSIHILNRSPTLAVQNITSEEAWYKMRPNVYHFRIFGCIAFAHIPDTKRKKLDDKVQNSSPIFQLDVKSAFLHGDLNEQVFIDQPPGYVKFAEQHKVYKLKKAFYGLKQAPRACTPTKVGLKLVRDPEGTNVDKTLSKQIVESLMYLTAIRPNIMHAIKGNVFMFGSGAISWSFKKQSIVTLSTTEAEFVAATPCAYQAIWLRNILEELHFKQGRAIAIYCDNNSAIKLSKNHVLHGRSKHIDVKFHFLRDLTKDEVIDLFYCKSEDQITNIMTKPIEVCCISEIKGVAWSLHFGGAGQVN